MRCLVLAGGLGTRLHPRTEHLAKCLIEVAGRPFAQLQLEWLASQGLRDVTFSIGHHGDQVRAALGDGSAFGVHIEYVDEGTDRRGTGGAVRLAVERDSLDEAFFVLYGDSYLRVDLEAVSAAFSASGCDALMTVYRNMGRFDRSNAVFGGGMVTRYEKGLAPPPSDMQFVDYGLSVLTPEVVVAGVPSGTPADLADLFSDLAATGRLAGFEATERFYEIGSPSGLADLESHLATSGGPHR